MGFRAVGKLVAKNVEVSPGLLKVVLKGSAVGIPRGDQKICQISAGTIVIGGQINGASQFLEGAVGVSQLEVRLAKLIVRLGEARIELEGVAVLDFRLAVLAIGEVLFTTVEVFLLADAGIARTAGQGSEEKRASHQHTDGNGATHS